MNKKVNWDGKMRGGIVMNKLLLILARFFGIGFAYFMLIPITTFYYVLSKKARGASREYLKLIFGKMPFLKESKEVYKHFYTFAQIIIDRFLFGIFPDRYEKIIEGEEILRDFAEKKQGLILLSAHIGNWKLASTIFSNYDIPINIMMLDTESERIKKFLSKEEKSRVNIIDLKDPVKATLDAKEKLERGEIVAIHGDRANKGQTIRVPFLGREANFPTGAFTISYVTKMPIVFTFTFKDGKTRYRFLADKPIYPKPNLSPDKRREQIREDILFYLSRVEDLLKKYPYQWFNFYKFWSEN